MSNSCRTWVGVLVSCSAQVISATALEPTVQLKNSTSLPVRQHSWQIAKDQKHVMTTWGLMQAGACWENGRTVLCDARLWTDSVKENFGMASKRGGFSFGVLLLCSNDLRVCSKDVVSHETILFDSVREPLARFQRALKSQLETKLSRTKVSLDGIGSIQDHFILLNDRAVDISRTQSCQFSALGQSFDPQE